MGAVEGLESWNTVLVRTEAGESLVQRAIEKGSLEAVDTSGGEFASPEGSRQEQMGEGKR